MKTTQMIMAGLVGVCGLAQADPSVTDFVTIGYANNTANTDGYGAVSYTYKISKYETTIAQMEASGAGSGNEGFWSAVDTNAPAVRVTLYEAMKYCNWLTSGNVDKGAYNFSDGVYKSTDRASAITSYGKVYAIPTEDEWYKAAYFNPHDYIYTLYANGTNPSPTELDDGLTGWNYDNVEDPRPWTVDQGTAEQNGTFNMMGNVAEWVEDLNGVYRGGSYLRAAAALGNTQRVTTSLPSAETDLIGFRIVEVIPER